jgi:Pentapeptide repeats (8 copies)
MKSWRSHLLIACAASTATAIVVGGIAFATIPNNLDGSISACYKTSAPNKGEVRIIDHQAGRACRSGESMLTWSSHAFRWRGAWNGAVAYKINDVVSLDGSSYIATAPTKNVLPLSLGYWSLMTAAGAPGGAAGATGPSGPTGPVGTTGPSGVAQCGGYPHNGIDWTVAGSTAGNGCNFTGATLVNQELSTANLTNANFSTANFTNADLTNANLTGANLTGATGMGTATVTGVIWSGTTCPDATVSNTNGTSPESCIAHM